MADQAWRDRPRRMAADIAGQAAARMVVIETDGTIEQADSLKSAFSGAGATGLHVTRDSLDAALLLPGIAARQIGARALASECRTCPVHRPGSRRWPGWVMCALLVVRLRRRSRRARTTAWSSGTPPGRSR